MDFLLQLLFSPLSTPAIISLFAVGAATLFYLNTRPSPLRSPMDLNKQTLGIKDGARKSALLEDNNNLMSYYHGDAKTIYEVFQRGLKVSGNGPCLGYRKPGRPYQWLRYKQVSDRAEHLGSGLLHKGLKPNSETFIGIFAQNRPEWIIAEQACYTYSMVAVPLYDTLGPEALVFIIDRAEISTVLCDNQSKAETLLQTREKGQTPVLKTIVVMDSFNSELVERGTKCGVDIVSMQDVEALGKSNLQKPVPPKPEDLSIVCFTSGTTGNPKGAMLTHENVVSDAAGVIKSFDVAFVPSTQDVSISFLPLAHMFERVVQTVMYGAGGRVGFFQGDIRLLPDDMKTLQPTIFPVVPRLLNRVYDKVQSGAKSPFKKWLLNFAVERKFAEVKEGIIRNNSVWDKLIFHKVQESLGGRVRVMVTGAAPISPSVLNFLRATLGCHRNWGCFRNVHNMLNIPTQSFPAPCSQQRVTPSGQSGRNKVALKPGHSLMDWIRYSKSGKDLTGLRGRLIEVTQEELQKHNKREDCWTCIRGMVYNVTPYMDYHPGGEDELMRAAGIDGTDLFDQVHRWVNYESMLKECLVGRMATKATTAIKAVISPAPPTGLAPPTSVAPPPDKDARPRFDWFQTDATVHLVIYAKRKIPSSGCTIVDLKAGVLRLEVLLGKMSYLIHLCLADEVEEQVTVHTAFSVGKIQVSIRKQNKGKWTSLGQPLEFHNTFLRKKDRALYYRDCVLVSKTAVNHNTHVFRLQLPRGTVMNLPVGKHVYLKALIQDTDVVRPYTPVDQNLAAASHHSSQESDLYLMIKVYPDGVFTSHLNSLHIGDCISVTGPEGPFSLRPLRDVTYLYLLAAGTGFTPMARLIQLAQQDIDTIRTTKLLFFNRREEDILWRCELDELAANSERFQVEYVLSDPCESWKGLKGRVDESMLKDFLERPDGSKCYVCVCGSTAFTELTIGLLKQQGFSEEELHAFQG